MPTQKEQAIAKAASAWEPLPRSGWNLDNACHLLRRMAFAATPEGVNEIKGMSPVEAVEFLLDRGETYAKPSVVANPESVRGKLKEKLSHAREQERKYDKIVEDAEKAGKKMMNSDARRKLAYWRKVRYGAERDVTNYLDVVFDEYCHDWLKFAAKPANSVREKLVMFLHNVNVVNRTDAIKGDQGVMFTYQKLLRENCMGSYKDLMKKISKAPAMMNMLDLQVNTRQKPNENFGRELMELFTMGRDRGYTEDDIKQASRAFTGYKPNGSDGHRIVQSEVDADEKTIFGVTRNFSGDDVIDLIFEQEETQNHLVRELCTYYLNADPLPEAFVYALGQKWAEADYNLRELFRIFFSSKMFFHTLNRGKIVKNPTELYLGLVKDLGVPISPFPRRVSQFLRMAGQDFLNPPDVEGWTGGGEWVNNATVQVRRVLIESFFLPVDSSVLDHEEKSLLKAANYDGQSEESMYVTEDRLKRFASKDNTELVDHLIRFFLPVEPEFKFRKVLIQHLSSLQGDPRPVRIRRVLLALLQSPYYQTT